MSSLIRLMRPLALLSYEQSRYNKGWNIPLRCYSVMASNCYEATKLLVERLAVVRLCKSEYGPYARHLNMRC